MHDPALVKEIIYFDIDAEVVFSVCKKHISELKITFQLMFTDL